GDRRHHRPRPAAGGPGNQRDSRHRGDRLGHDTGPQEDHGRRLRRIPDQADPGARVQGRGPRDSRPARPDVGKLMAEKILAVGDVPVTVKLLAALLMVKGYDVVTAANGAEALTRVEKDRPGLVLLDVMMPGMSGYDVCRKIRENPVTAMLPVV